MSRIQDRVWKIGKNQKSIIFNRAWTIVAQNPSKRITEGIILVGRKWEEITFITFYRRNEEREKKNALSFCQQTISPCFPMNIIIIMTFKTCCVLLNVVKIIAMWDPIWIIFTIWGNKTEFHTFIDVLLVWYWPRPNMK